MNCFPYLRFRIHSKSVSFDGKTLETTANRCHLMPMQVLIQPIFWGLNETKNETNCMILIWMTMRPCPLWRIGFCSDIFSFPQLPEICIHPASTSLPWLALRMAKRPTWKPLHRLVLQYPPIPLRSRGNTQIQYTHVSQAIIKKTKQKLDYTCMSLSSQIAILIGPSTPRRWDPEFLDHSTPSASEIGINW